MRVWWWWGRVSDVMDMSGAMTRLEEEELGVSVSVSARVVARPVVEPGRVSVVMTGDLVTVSVRVT